MGSERRIEMPRVLIPMLGMIALALIVNGLSAQERDEAAERPAPPTVRAAPAPPAVVSLRTARSGAYLGVMIREVDADDVDRLDLPEERGALVTEVPDDGPAAAAGLRADDVIESWNDRRVESAAQLTRLVRETPIGRRVEIGYVRDGRRASATAELGERPGVSRLFRRGGLDADARRRLGESLGRVRRGLEFHGGGDGFAGYFVRGGRLGIGVQNLTDQLAEYFGAEDGGALVATVRDDSPAAEAGLRAGDVIVRIAEEPVDDRGDVMREIARADAGEVEIRVLRDGGERTLRATLPERPAGADVDLSENFSRFEWPELPGIELQLPEPADPERSIVRT
ncbi:MAG: PDZ domain-containing protein [Gemmatimonadota bacterium]